jgi:Putative Flp pilus-assembly TadE/G-like
MRLRPAGRGECGERGAIAILTAFLTVVVLAVAALGVDIATQVNERQKLHDTVDAAAHAGAYRLPLSGTLADSDARAFATNNGLTVTPSVDFFCVVASKLVGGIWVVDNSQIPATCNPASVGGSFTGFRCNTRICSIPCNPAALDLCNTIRVSATKPVPFSFAPAVGITQPGSTGAVTSVACKGSCGTIPLNPMDVAVVADRTGSMSSTDINAMIAGIKSMFQKMTPSQQYVALGTIGWSSSGAAANCKSMDSPSSPTGPSDATGLWIPVPFSSDYLTAGTTNINTTSPLVQAVNCLTNASGTGTHLAAPMKAAARYLLGLDANNLGTFPARTGIVRKAIIFETDGAPNEKYTGGDPALSATGGIGSAAPNTTDAACNNLKTVATNAKSATPGILVVTVAFNAAKINAADKCSTAGGSAWLVDTLAAAASDKSPGVPSAANFDCADATVGGGQYKENTDGDYFFCAGTGTDMAAIFVTAFTQIANGIRLIQLP